MQKFRLVAIALLCAAYSAAFASAPPPPPPAPAPAPAPATDDRDRDRDRDDKSSHDIKKVVKKVFESLKEKTRREN